MKKESRLNSLVILVAACGTDMRDPSSKHDTLTDAGIVIVQDAAPTQPSSDACVPQVTQLLVNPAFDMAPQGKGWIETLAVPGYPLITSQDGVPEHTPSYKAWLGGFPAPSGTIKDALTQDVTIPALTSHLVLRGRYDVRTAEEPTTTAYDTVKLVVTELDGTPIQTVLSLSNASETSTWAIFGHAFTQNLSGKTVRVRLISSNDIYDETSFFFDSFELTATHGCN
jgi:hypothetical protein